MWSGSRQADSQPLLRLHDHVQLHADSQRSCRPSYRSRLSPSSDSVQARGWTENPLGTHPRGTMCIRHIPFRCAIPNRRRRPTAHSLAAVPTPIPSQLSSPQCPPLRVVLEPRLSHASSPTHLEQLPPTPSSDVFRNRILAAAGRACLAKQFGQNMLRSGRLHLWTV